MEGGEIDAFQRWAESLAEDLGELARKLRAGEVKRYVNGEWQPHPDPHGAAESVDSARHRVVSMHSRIAILQQDIRALASLAHGVEWWQSGDYGPDQVVEACLALAQRGGR
jgi:hypothetical protein